MVTETSVALCNVLGKFIRLGHFHSIDVLLGEISLKNSYSEWDDIELIHILMFTQQDKERYANRESFVHSLRIYWDKKLGFKQAQDWIQQRR